MEGLIGKAVASAAEEMAGIDSTSSDEEQVKGMKETGRGEQWWRTRAPPMSAGQLCAVHWPLIASVAARQGRKYAANPNFALMVAEVIHFSFMLRSIATGN
eukprot:6187908-Pleurochrysis_carterae.AAC.1